MLIRATHPWAFRTGEWATVLTTFVMSPPGREPRECWLVQFPDGQHDCWPVADALHGYEFREPEEEEAVIETPQGCGCHDPIVWGHRMPTCRLGLGPKVNPHPEDLAVVPAPLRWIAEASAEKPEAPRGRRGRASLSR
jgi:hypothetical protein